MGKFAAGFALGFLSIWIIYRAQLDRAWEVHRVYVSYPTRWEEGELRNCQIKQHFADNKWPELECDGSGSKAEALAGAHSFAMDIRFEGEWRIPPTKEQGFTWTCQTRDHDISCKDWQ